MKLYHRIIKSVYIGSVASPHRVEGGSTEHFGFEKNTHIILYNLYFEPFIFQYCTTDPIKLKTILTYSL
jgi:hypothetical protein